MRWIVALLLVGCGSADAPGGFSVSMLPDGGTASGGSSTGGASPGGSSSGGAQASGGSAGAASCVNKECSDSLNGCCAEADCVPGLGTVGRCMAYCATDTDCPSGWGCVENGRGCGKFAPAFSCFDEAGTSMERTCAPPCSTQADCGNGSCISFWGTRYSSGGSSTDWGPCPLTPRNFCAPSSLSYAVKCPG